MSTSRPVRRPGLLAVLTPLVALALLVGCSGSSNDDDAGSDVSTTTVPEDAAFEPVTIEHRYGSTEITERPERIVSLDSQWTDVLAALDGPLVGHLADVSTGEAMPWQVGLEGSTELVATTTADLPDVEEEILRLDPDLIVVTYLADSQETFDRLARIAPTVASLSDSEVDTWQDIAGAAGEVLGQPDDAAELVTGVEDQVTALAEELPGLAGLDYTFTNYVPGDAMYALSDPADGANILFGELGLTIAPAITDAEDDSPGRVKLSLENVDLLDADLVMVLFNGADPASVPGFNDLPAVQAGAWLDMDLVLATALNVPTPLSIPYALDELRPALEAAAV